MGPGPPPSPNPSPAPSGQALSSARRAELADFLRRRRGALKPDDVGLAPVRGRRRTPGLRREEVAQRSGVGLSWYTWLEQGRDVTPSDQVLLALSRALEMSPSEREHLFLLAGVAQPPSPSWLGAPDSLVDDETAALVQGLLPHIAFVLGPRFDVVVHNRAAELIMSDLLTAPAHRRNLLLWLFAPDGPDRPGRDGRGNRTGDHDSDRAGGADRDGQGDDGDGWGEANGAWERTARANLLDFRTEFARHPGDPAFVALVDELTARSATFRTWWERHDVQVLEPSRKRIAHPALGPLSFLSVQSRPAHAPWLRLRVLVPGDEHTRTAVADAVKAGPATPPR